MKDQENPGTHNKTYKLPSAFALALGSGRGELAGLAANQVRSGELVLDQEIQCELIRLVGDLIDESRIAHSGKSDVEAVLLDLDEAHEKFKEAYAGIQDVHDELDTCIKSWYPEGT
jgi:hypothetical protein